MDISAAAATELNATSVATCCCSEPAVLSAGVAVRSHACRLDCMRPRLAATFANAVVAAVVCVASDTAVVLAGAAAAGFARRRAGG